MNIRNLQTLLSIIDRNENVDSLLKQGLTFKQIADLTNSAMIDGLIVSENDKITLSELGIAALGDLRSKMKRIDKEQWIEKEKSSQIEKIEINSIFLPDPNELFF